MNHASFANAFIMVCMLVSLTAMFTTAFSHMPLSSLTKETRTRGSTDAGRDKTDASGAMLALPEEPAQSAMTEQSAGELMELMGKLQSTPNDADVLRRIGIIFIEVREWKRAEVFLSRATLSRPKDISSRYLLGTSQYEQNKFTEAAQSFEELLVLKAEPRAMYNLAIIYKYHTGRKAEAEALLRKIITTPEVDADIISKAKAEL